MRDGSLLLGCGRGFLDVLSGCRLLFISAHDVASLWGKEFKKIPLVPNDPGSAAVLGNNGLCLRDDLLDVTLEKSTDRRR
jgi:hypothetical protein